MTQNAEESITIHETSAHNLRQGILPLLDELANRTEHLVDQDTFRELILFSCRSRRSKYRFIVYCRGVLAVGAGAVAPVTARDKSPNAPNPGRFKAAPTVPTALSAAPAA